MFINTDIINSVFEMKYYSLANQAKHLASVNMRKYVAAFRDSVCGPDSVRASQEMRQKLRVTVSSPTSRLQTVLFISCMLKVSSTGTNNKLFIFDTVIKKYSTQPFSSAS